MKVTPFLLSLVANLMHSPDVDARAAPIPRQLSHPAGPYLPAQESKDSGFTRIARQHVSSGSATSLTTSSAATSTPTGPRNHNVAVGQNGTAFTPTMLKRIPIGDTITFYFYPSNYSLVQSSFDSPCTAMKETGGVDPKAIFSGFHASSDEQSIATQKFVVKVTTTATTWIYGVDGDDLRNGNSENACEKGMVMVVNPLPKSDAAGETLSTYRKNAARLARKLGAGGTKVKEIVPGAVWGGEIRPVGEKEMARWEAKHPVGGATTNGNGTQMTSMGTGNSAAQADDQGDYGVMQYASGCGRVDGNSLMAVAVLIGACVFGLGS